MQPTVKMSQNQEEFEKNGFATVADSKILNFAKLIELHGSKLVSFDEVKDKLTFLPQTISADLGFWQ